MEDQNRLMTIEEVASFLNVSEKQVYRYSSQEENPLKITKISNGTTRIVYKDLVSWIKLQSKKMEDE